MIGGGRTLGEAQVPNLDVVVVAVVRNGSCG
jgi:hypothetical protein